MRPLHMIAVYAVLFGGPAILIKIDDLKRKSLLSSAAKIPHPVLPEEAPTPSQEAVDKAMKLFSISIGEQVDGPYYDESITDRGLTTLEKSTSKKTVFIGPAAFESWAMLGSTLAHEIEVHANQSFYKATFLDMIWFGTPGTDAAEKEAYGFEIRCRKRFGLSKDEVDLIHQTVNFYYP